MVDAASVAERYIAVWNEPDPDRREARLATDWSEAAQYADPLMRGQGRAQIEGLIAAVQARFAGHRFTLTGQPDGHGSYVRFSWTLAANGSAPVARGTDFVHVDQAGRVREVVGFLDEVAV